MTRHTTGVVRIGLVTLLCGVLAWQAIVAALSAEAVNRHEPESALGLAPGSGDAAAMLAEERLARGDAEGARSAALQAVQRSPMSVSAVRALALADMRLGKTSEGTTLMNAAAGFGWRDGAVQLWTARAAMQAGDLPQAALRLDALLRGALNPTIFFPVLDAAMASPAFRRQMVPRLALSPDWRRSYFVSEQPISARSRTVRAAALVALGATSSPPSRADVRVLLKQFLAAGDYAGAYATWRPLAAPAGLASAPLFDGSFELVPPDPADAIPFEWTLGNVPDAAASADPAPAGGHALHLTTREHPSAGILATQIVLPAPGTWHLRMRVPTASGAANAAFRWQMVCLPSNHDLTGFQLSTRTGGSQRVDVVFAVPAAGCPAVQLRLRVRPGYGASELWIDDASLQQGGG